MDQPDLPQQARDALAAGDLKRGLALADQCVAAEPDNPIFRYWRANALLGLGSAREALKEAREALRTGPDLYEAHWVQAEAARELGHYGQAQQAFERALELSGQEADILVAYAVFMACHRGPRPAEEAAMDAIQAAPESPDAWAALGLTQFRLHRFTEAEFSLQRALQIDPDNALAKMYMAMFLRSRGQHAQAGAMLRLLEDHEQSGPFVEAIRQAEREKRSMARVYERQEVQDAEFGGARHRGWRPYVRPMAWACLICAGAVGLMYLNPTPVIVVWVVLMAALYWWLRRI